MWNSYYSPPDDPSGPCPHNDATWWQSGAGWADSSSDGAPSSIWIEDWSLECGDCGWCYNDQSAYELIEVKDGGQVE